jgi:uncharacterized membrane protein
MARERNASSRSRWPKPIRIVVGRPRLFLAILVGIGVAVLLSLYSTEMRGVTRLLIAWDVGVSLYLVLAYRMIANSSVRDIHRQYLLQDEGGFAILVLTVAGACASVAAVVAWLEVTSKAVTFAMPGLGFLLGTIMLSWGFIHTIFALHYAHEYYAEHGGAGGGLIFPGDPEPTYWDFVYFAFGIGTATQVSDVQINSKRIRRTVTVHSIVSFFFNVTVIALTVGLVGDAIQT